MNPKKGDTVELLSCELEPTHKFNGETGVVEWVAYGVVVLTKPPSCGHRFFFLREVKIISKKEVSMKRKYEFSKDGLRVGDIVIDTDGTKTKILEVFENSFVYSNWGDFGTGCYLSQFKDAIGRGWTIEQPVKPKSKALLKKIAEAKKFLKEQGEM